MSTFTKTVRTTCGAPSLHRYGGIPVLTRFAGPVVNGLLNYAHVPANFCNWPEGNIYVANGIHKIHKWDGLKSGFVPVGLDAPTGTPTISGSGSGTITGTYRIYTRFVDADGRPSPLSNPSSDTALTTDLTLTFGSLPVPTDTRVVRRQVLRNTAGQLDVFYVDVDTTDLWSTSLTSTQTDDDLSTNDNVSIFNEDGDSLIDQWDPPRSDKPLLAVHRSRMFLGGEIVYRRGNAQVTFGSTTVTGTATGWTSQMANRELIVVGQGKRYTISSVDESAQTLTLAEPYRGTTNKFAAYMIRTAPSDRTAVYFSEAGNPDGYIGDNFQIAEVGDEPTALISAESYLYVAFRESLYRISFSVDPSTDGDVSLVTFRGCVNQRAWVKLAGDIFCLDHLGLYKLSDGGVEELANPIRDLFSKQAGGTFKIDWTRQEFFHACADPENQTIRFYVSLTGPTLPRHAICYSLLMRQFWIEEYPFPIAASALLQTDRDHVLLGGPGQNLLEAGLGYLDGLNDAGYVTSAQVTAASLMSVTCPTLVLPSTGVVGFPIAIVKGRGKGQVRLVNAFTASTGKLVVTQPWLVKPDTTSVVQVGAIKWRWKSGWREIMQQGGTMELVWAPVPHTAYLTMQIFVDHLSTPETYKIDREFPDQGALSVQKDTDFVLVDLTFDGGYAQYDLRSGYETPSRTGRFIAVELGGFSGQDGVLVHTLFVGGAQ